MKKDAIPLLNSALLLALLVGGGVVVFLGERDSPRDSPPGEGGPPAGVAGESAALSPAELGSLAPAGRPAGEDPGAKIAALEAKVSGLQVRLADLESRVAMAPTAEADRARPGAATLAPESSAGALDRVQVKALIQRELEERRRAREAQQAQAAAQAKKPKRTLAQVTQELSLTPVQATKIQTHLEDIERESMRILFALDPDNDLVELQAQLELSKQDPALKEKLREQVSISWTRNQKEFWVLYVKLDTKLRKLLPKETLADFYRYEVRLDRPNFPDMESFFKEADADEPPK